MEGLVELENHHSASIIVNIDLEKMDAESMGEKV